MKACWSLGWRASLTPERPVMTPAATRPLLFPLFTRERLLVFPFMSLSRTICGVTESPAWEWAWHLHTENKRRHFWPLQAQLTWPRNGYDKSSERRGCEVSSRVGPIVGNASVPSGACNALSRCEVSLNPLWPRPYFSAGVQLFSLFYL